MSAAAYARGVLGFVAATAAPYFAQRASMEILNHLAHVDFSNAVERSLRIEASLADDGALAAAAASNMTIDAHASALRSVVDTAFQARAAWLSWPRAPSAAGARHESRATSRRAPRGADPRAARLRAAQDRALPRRHRAPPAHGRGGAAAAARRRRAQGQGGGAPLGARRGAPPREEARALGAHARRGARRAARRARRRGARDRLHARAVGGAQREGGGRRAFALVRLLATQLDPVAVYARTTDGKPATPRPPPPPSWCPRPPPTPLLARPTSLVAAQTGRMSSTRASSA